MDVNNVVKRGYGIVLSLLVGCLPAAVFAQQAEGARTSPVSAPPARWYFGAEYGLPFLVGDLTTFSAGKPRRGYQAGGFAGYRFNHKVGLELAAGGGETKLGPRSYAADYRLDAQGVTYYVEQAFPTWAYRDIEAEVRYIQVGLQANLNLNNLFSAAPRARRWTVLLSPAVYMQHFRPELHVKAGETRLAGAHADKLNLGLGGNLALRYSVSRLFDLRLRTGILWVNNNRMDGVSTLIRSKDHFMLSTGIAWIWKRGKTSSVQP